MVVKRVRGSDEEATYTLEIYAVELKNIQQIRDEKPEALRPDSLGQKCQSCLDWAEGIVRKFNTVMQNPKRTTIEGYCVIAVPANVLTLAKRKLPRPKPGNAKDVLIIACGEPIMQRPRPRT